MKLRLSFSGVLIPLGLGLLFWIVFAFLFFLAKANGAQIVYDTNSAVRAEAGTNQIGPATSVDVEGPVKIVWYIPGVTNQLHLSIQTNLITNWVTTKQLAVVRSNVVRVKQVGTVQTNRTMFVSYGKTTNSPLALLDVLGETDGAPESRIVNVTKE